MLVTSIQAEAKMIAEPGDGSDQEDENRSNGDDNDDAREFASI